MRIADGVVVLERRRELLGVEEDTRERGRFVGVEGDEADRIGEAGWSGDPKEEDEASPRGAETLPYIEVGLDDGGDLPYIEVGLDDGGDLAPVDGEASGGVAATGFAFACFINSRTLGLVTLATTTLSAAFLLGSALSNCLRLVASNPAITRSASFGQIPLTSQNVALEFSLTIALGSVNPFFKHFSISSSPPVASIAVLLVVPCTLTNVPTCAETYVRASTILSFIPAQSSCSVLWW